MSPADVRHHLGVLLADGRLQSLGVNHSGRRGRPAKLYALSARELGDNLPSLADIVLGELLDGRSPAAQEGAIKAAGRRLAGIVAREAKPDMPLARQLVAIIDALNHANYQARWEAGAQGPRLLFAHCPYAAIIARHPELCHLDAEMIRAATHIGARQTAKIGTDAAQSCIFVLDTAAGRLLSTGNAA